MLPSPGTLKAPLMTACRKLQWPLRASFTTFGRTSLQCTWQILSICLFKTASASPPANVICPVSNSKPTSGPVKAIS